MGQNISTEEGSENEQRELDEQPGVLPKTQKKQNKHQFFISNGDLETVGDLDSILQAINVSPVSPDSGGSIGENIMISRFIISI